MLKFDRFRKFISFNKFILTNLIPKCSNCKFEDFKSNIHTLSESCNVFYRLSEDLIVEVEENLIYTNKIVNHSRYFEHLFASKYGINLYLCYYNFVVINIKEITVFNPEDDFSEGRLSIVLSIVENQYLRKLSSLAQKIQDHATSLNLTKIFYNESMILRMISNLSLTNEVNKRLLALNKGTMSSTTTTSASHRAVIFAHNFRATATNSQQINTKQGWIEQGNNDGVSGKNRANMWYTTVHTKDKKQSKKIAFKPPTIKEIPIILNLLQDNSMAQELAKKEILEMHKDDPEELAVVKEYLFNHHW